MTDTRYVRTSNSTRLGRPKGNAAGLCHVVGITYRQLDYWCRTGALGLHALEPVGSGAFRLFTPDEIFRVFILASFSQFYDGNHHGSVYPFGEDISALTLADATKKFTRLSEDEATTLVIDLPLLAKRTRSFMEAEISKEET